MGVVSACLRGGKGPPGGPRAPHEPDRHGGGHSGHARNPIQGKSPRLPPGGNPDRVPLGHQRRILRAQGFSSLPGNETVFRKGDADPTEIPPRPGPGENEILSDAPIRKRVPLQLRKGYPLGKAPGQTPIQEGTLQG